MLIVNVASLVGNLLLILAGVEVFRNGYFGAGSGPILYTYLTCGGTESRLSDCTYSSYYFGARHSNDAGVRCQRPTITSKHNN